MAGNDGIQFDTSTVRGFAEWLYNQVHKDGGYKSQIDQIIEHLGGSAGKTSGGDGYHGDDANADAQTVGTSGVDYYGKDYGVAQVKSAEAAVKYLNGLRVSLQDMADAAGVAAEDLPGQDGKNSDAIKDHIELPDYEKTI